MRYASLKRTFPDNAAAFFSKAGQQAQARYEKYVQLAQQKAQAVRGCDGCSGCSDSDDELIDCTAAGHIGRS